MLPSKVCIENYAKLFRIQKFIGYFFQSNCGGYGINGVGQDFGGDFFFDFYLVTINLSCPWRNAEDAGLVCLFVTEDILYSITAVSDQGS